MEQLTDFSDSRNKGFCIHCGGALRTGESNRDHVPTKGFLNPPYPENLPVVDVCRKCNSGFASDEEYLIAFLGSLLSGSTTPDLVRFPKAASILSRSSRLRNRIARSQTVQGTLWGDPEVLWEPEFERIKRVIVKNARGHVLYEIGEPSLFAPSLVEILPFNRLSVRQKERFENVPRDSAFPEVGSRMAQRLIIAGTSEAKVGGWLDVQNGVYRYAVSSMSGHVLVRTVLYEYLATEVMWSD